ncbi:MULTISPECIES: electron transfer flavoprotein subunit alpha/FixB family protein [Amycolatopsis]|uniref:Electron transfer flavoprotein subunit alpha/FixB family protein n=1 Tax=Amycolatopsis dendrobii TaxID=2760662 RepID=A0A7W3ZBE5_9PSEU|nr:MULTISPECIES: electron transfer flavoprotein subunit alpha/FixB family protein [Amycolatopsis]MBB1155205.1 electron transfer flavoprotein subunit alpha/FixB family protein [Amycolatopsis dendrobii]MCG3756954.1 electron transfer flavoprotein subunit alpha/FixB family protein [Amycolatopsis sp. Poz14]UKD54847.1 electron transfer flavoprotein subunit alpha/FixB family protein [Amycolatopsis sp. FU40]
MAEVLVLVDHVDGDVKKVTLELLTAARALGEPSAVVVGPTGTAAKAKEALAGHGAAKVYVAEGDDAAGYLVTPKVDVLAKLAEQVSPAAVLVAASAEGKEVAARVALRLGSGLLYDAVGVNADGTVDQSIFGGAFSVKAKAAKGAPVVSVRPGAVEAEAADGAAAEETVEIPAQDPAKSAKITGIEPVVGGDRPELTEASIVVSGGRGVGSAEKFDVVEKLADSLGAAVGASRAAVDSGYYPAQFQVGQTGKTVSPQLYIALGISGAIQHRAGMQTSKTIIAVNKDAEAPIFEIADFGVVGDLFNVAPQLTDAVDKRKG